MPPSSPPVLRLPLRQLATPDLVRPDPCLGHHLERDKVDDLNLDLLPVSLAFSQRTVEISPFVLPN
jgi:hypothetical protein